MTDTMEVEATPIERAIEPSSGLDQLVAEITGEAERLAAEYRPREIATEEDFKQSKRERAGARKDISALKQRYNDAMRTIKDAVAEADARAKKAIAPLEAIDSGYKQEVDAYEARWKLERMAMLAEEYADFAPDLVPLVPFERLMGRFGCERGRQWDARSMGDAQAVAAMQQAVEVIANDERTITDSPYDDADKAALKADYFRTLDLSGSLRRVQEAKDQRERVAELERQRAEREAEAARARAEQTEQAAQAEQERQERPVEVVNHMTMDEYVAELDRVGTPMAQPQRVTQHQELTRTLSGGQTMLVALYSVTPEQMRRLAATLSAQGIHGKPKGTGLLLSEEQCADLLEFANTRAQGYDAPKARREL